MFELLESKRVSSPGIALHVGLVVLGAIATGKFRTPWPLIAAVLIGLYILFSIKVVRQWEKVAVLPRVSGLVVTPSLLNNGRWFKSGWPHQSSGRSAEWT